MRKLKKSVNGSFALCDGTNVAFYFRKKEFFVI